MKKLVTFLGALTLGSCSALAPVELTANPERDGVSVHFKSKKPIQDMNQGTLEKPVLTGFFFRTFNQSGQRVGDDIFLGFNSSNYLKEIKKNKEGEAFIEYSDILATLHDWYSENPGDLKEIHRVEIFWKPYFSGEYLIPVKCSIDDGNGMECK